MAITIREQRRQEWTIGAYGNASRLWHIFGTDDIDAAKAQVLTTAAATWLGLFRDDSKIRVAEKGYKWWEATVPYSPFDLTGGGTPPTVFSFRTSGGTEKITQTNTVTKYNASGQTAVEYNGGINANKSGGFDGVEIGSPIFDFEIESYLPAASVNNAYLATLVSLTWKLNNAVFKGFAIGECAYVGAQGCQERGGSYRLTHGFKASPNRTSLSLANGLITGVSKKGWQYLWVDYLIDKVGGNKKLIPRGAYVHDTYMSGNFNLLGL